MWRPVLYCRKRMLSAGKSKRRCVRLCPPLLFLIPMRIALRPPSGSALWACWATREGPRARPGRPRSPAALIRALSRRLHDVRACTASPPRSSRSSLPPPPHVPSAGRSWRRRRPALAPPSPRASRWRSRDTRLRLAAPSLRRSAPFEVAIGRASAAVAPPALTESRALGEAAQGGAGAAIATSRAAAVARHPAAARGAVSAALGAV